MRIVMRVLVGLSLPVLAFGWLATVQGLEAPAAPSLSAAAVFAAAGAALALLGSAAATGRALLAARPVELLPLSVTVLGGLGLVVEGLRRSQGNAPLDVWPPVLIGWGGYFAGALALVVLVRSLAGLWSWPDLPMLPSRRTVVGLLLMAAVAAAPAADQPGVQLLHLA